MGFLQNRACGNDPGVVQDQQVTLATQVLQVQEFQIPVLTALARKVQQPARGSLRQRRLCDECFREPVVELN